MRELTGQLYALEKSLKKLYIIIYKHLLQIDNIFNISDFNPRQYCYFYLEFDRGPRTRIGPGECTADLIFVNASSGLIDPHQIWA